MRLQQSYQVGIFLIFFVQNSLYVCPAGTDIQSQGQDKESILYEASLSGDPSVIRHLLDNGADANIIQHTGRMPIHSVARQGYLE